MNHKLKSLLFLSCFIIAGILYHLDLKKYTSEEFDSTDKELAEADVVIKPFSNHLEEVQTK